jgi:hypothetical protein
VANPTNSVPNLRETRKEQAAARRGHPAGKAAPAKAGAPKPAAKKRADATAAPKLRWSYPEGRDNRKDNDAGRRPADGYAAMPSTRSRRWVTASGKPR